MLKAKFLRFVMSLAIPLMWRGKAPQNMAVSNRRIPVRGGEIGVRLYTPESAGPHPVIVYFHGGGFVIGNLETVDAACRDLVANTGHVVVSVDYRLAPEHPFPAAAHDCIDAVQWVAGNAATISVDAGRLYVAGDSAGGNLAAVSALALRAEHPGVIKGQILLYPVTHHYSYGAPSYEEKAKGYGLTRDMMVWFWDTYYKDATELPGGQLTHPLSTPLTEDLSGLPPALVLTAEHDPLRDEGADYAKRMADAGVAVQYTLYDNARHGFVGTLGPTSDHTKGIAEIAAWLSAGDA